MKPKLTTLFPLTLSISPSHTPVIVVSTYSNGGQSTLKNLFTTKSYIFLSLSLKSPRNTLSSVGMIA